MWDSRAAAALVMEVAVHTVGVNKRSLCGISLDSTVNENGRTDGPNERCTDESGERTKARQACTGKLQLETAVGEIAGLLQSVSCIAFSMRIVLLVSCKIQNNQLEKRLVGYRIGSFGWLILFEL